MRRHEVVVAGGFIDVPGEDDGAEVTTWFYNAICLRCGRTSLAIAPWRGWPKEPALRALQFFAEDIVPYWECEP